MNTLLVGGIQYQQLDQGQPSDSIITSAPFISFLNSKQFPSEHTVETMFFLWVPKNKYTIQHSKYIFTSSWCSFNLQKFSFMHVSLQVPVLAYNFTSGRWPFQHWKIHKSKYSKSTIAHVFLASWDCPIDLYSEQLKIRDAQKRF